MWWALLAKPLAWRASTHLTSFSRREAFLLPTAIGLQGEENAVVEAARAALPELDGGGEHAVAAPVRRPRHVAVRILGHQFGVAAFQESPIGDDDTLGRG